MRYDKIEFKITARPDEEPAVQDLLRRAKVPAARRRVYFFDTPQLDLFARDLVLRARITDGDDDDSTVKLRPVPGSGVPDAWSDARIELDVVGTKEVPSAKLDGKPSRGEIEEVERGDRKVGKLFSQAQEALVAPQDVDELTVLGPIDARKWDLPKEIFPLDLSVEQWSLPDGTHFFELSFKVKPEQRDDAQRAFAALLKELEIKGDPEAKTPKVLRFFAAQ
jgi:uncharacterized protein YjbK